VLNFVAVLRQRRSLQQDCWSDKTRLGNTCNTWRSLGPRCVYTWQTFTGLSICTCCCFTWFYVRVCLCWIMLSFHSTLLVKCCNVPVWSLGVYWHV